MSQALKKLRSLHFEHWRRQYPAIEEKYYPRPTYQVSKANGLTRAIIDFIRFNGGQAERISSEGRVIDKRQTVTDVIGRVKTIGSVQRTYSSTTNGTSDLSAIIPDRATGIGRSVKIEVKVGKDRQSEAQKAYQEAVTRAGGIYYVARDFEAFVEWYNQTFGSKEGGGNG